VYTHIYYIDMAYVALTKTIPMTIRLFSKSLVFQYPHPISGHLHQTSLITTPDRTRGLTFADKTNYIIYIQGDSSNMLHLRFSLNNEINEILIFGIFLYLPSYSKIIHIFSKIWIFFYYLKCALWRYILLFFKWEPPFLYYCKLLLFFWKRIND